MPPITHDQSYRRNQRENPNRTVGHSNQKEARVNSERQE